MCQQKISACLPFWAQAEIILFLGTPALTRNICFTFSSLYCINMLRPFVMIPSSEVPIFPIWQPEAKTEFGKRSGRTAEETHRLVRTPALSLPEIPVAGEYLQWFTRAVGDSVPTYRICVENLDEWRSQYGEGALRDMLHSLLHLGRPTCHWVFMHHMESKDDAMAGATAPSSKATGSLAKRN